MLGEIQFVMVNGFINERPIPLVGFVGENDARQIKVVTFDDMSTVSVTELVIGDIEAGIFEAEQKTIPVFDRLSGAYVDRTQTTLSIYLNEEMLGDAGLKFLQLVMYNETGEIVKKTNQFIVRVGDSNTPVYYAPETKTVKTLETYVKETNKEAVKLAFGLQEEVTSSNDFVNKKTLYVYKGNEEDYQNGYWYYYDDTQKKWLPGGPYKNPTDEVLRLLAQKQDALTFDSVPTENSQNPVTSDGVFKALSESGHQITMDEFPINGSTNPVTSDGLYRKFGEVDAQHQSLSTRVGRIQEEQTELANGVQQNTTDIAQNTSDISSQGVTIAEHQTSISENASAIEVVRGIANTASNKADAIDDRLDNIIVESGTSDAETIAARTNANTGITYTTLGQRLDEENSEIKEDLSAFQTATTDDVGKALKAKTITDGKVTEWEFGETGDAEVLAEHTAELAMLLTKTPKPAPVPTEITQCVDISKATPYNNGKRYYNVKIEMPWLGRYDMNPSNLNLRFYYMRAYDKDGNLLTSYRNGDENNSIGCPKGGYAVKVDERTIKTYTATGTLDWTWTADGDIAYLYSSETWGGVIGDATEADQLVGVTFAGASETYVPYEPIDPDVPIEYDYSPNSNYADAIQEYYATNGFINKTLNIEGCAADSKAVGDELCDRKGISFETVAGWIRPGDGVLIGGTNSTATDFIPVTPGETIRVNRPALRAVTDNAFYSASKGFVSALTTPSSINDITIPENVHYVRFSDYNSAMVGFTVERTGLWTRIRDAISESSGEAEYRHLIEQSRYGGNPLTLLHFSDLHMDATTMGFINAFRLKYADLLDDVIQTGDVCNGFSNNWGTLVSVGLGECLGVIGNHEALGDSTNSATQQELHEKFIEPYIGAWNVTQPTGVDDSTSEHYCANYYYKDYTSATIRLIVLDTQKWSSAQMTWFTATLESARTAGYAVIVASHILPGKVMITDCNFSAKYINGTNISHTFPTGDAPLATEDAVGAVNDFITSGGEFVVWIGGHEHADIFGVFTNYPNVTAYMIDKASINRETPGAARISGEKNQHAFNIMSVVRSGKLLKIVRIGEDVDGLMRGKHVFCYNYNTKTIISQW